MMKKMMRIWLGLIGLSLMMVIDGLHPAAAVQLVGNEIAISTVSGQKEDVPTVAHSSIDNRFLVAWTDKRNLATTDIDLYMQVIDADGTLLGGNLPLSTAPHVQKIPAIGYSPVNNSFLTTWSDRRNSQTFLDDNFGQLVSPDGNLVGTDFAISTAPKNQGGPAVAYDSVRDRFLEVWTDSRNSLSGKDIFGQLVNSDGTLAGTLVGENFSITTENTDQFRPAVAYSEANDLFMVIWVDCRDNAGSCSQRIQVGTMIFGQLIDANGTLVNGSFPITSVMANHTEPVVAYNNVDGQFLVVWEDGRNLAASGTDIFGQRVRGNGMFLGNNFPISAAMADQNRPTVAHSPTDNQFLVIWSDARNKSTTKNDIFGQAVSGDGTLVGANLPISVAPQNQDRPAVSYNLIDNQFLVVWRDSRNTPFDIFGQRATLAP